MGFAGPAVEFIRSGKMEKSRNSFGEDLTKLLWRGRWRDLRMLSIYIQELAAASVLMRLDDSTTAFVNELAALFESLLGISIEEHSHGG